MPPGGSGPAVRWCAPTTGRTRPRGFTHGPRGCQARDRQGAVTDLRQETAQSGEVPEWFKREAIVESLDVTPLIEAGEHPLERVVARVRQLQPGEIFELIAGFVPEPLLDIVRKQGFVVWTTRDDNARYRNYISKPSTSATFDV